MPSRLLKKITRYRHMGITTYDPTAANGSAEAARACAHIAPARSITSAGEHQRMIFTVVVDT